MTLKPNGDLNGCGTVTPTHDGISISETSDVGVSHHRSGGLSSFVERCLGKPLDKSQQLSNWTRRPLTSDQVHYAG